MTSPKQLTLTFPTSGTCTTATPRAVTSGSSNLCNWPCSGCGAELTDYNSSIGTRYTRQCLRCWTDLILEGSEHGRKR